MMEIPAINIEQKISNIDELPEESSDEQNSNEETEEDETEYSDEGEEEDESVEEEEIDREMTSEEKKAMYEAVKCGDVDALEECLDKPHSDINMIWFKENLLMAAIRHGQEEMAEFLLDNGVDYTYSTAVMELRGTPRGVRIDRYDLTCRQMAYDRGLMNIVQIIDLLEGNVFPFVHLPDRTPRHRRPKPTTFSDGSDESDGDFGDTASFSDSKGSVQSSRRSEETTQKMTDVDTESVGVYQEQTETQGLSIQVEKGYHHAREHYSKKHVNKKQQNWNKYYMPENEIQESDKSRHKVEMANVDLFHSRLDSNIMKSHSHLSVGGLYSQVSKNTDKLILNNKPERNDKCLPKATFRRHTVTKDTASNDPPEPKSSESAQPTNRVYLSKSAPTLLKVNNCTRLLSDPQANIQNRPLKWRKVTTTGSYTTESRHWHINTMQRQKSSEGVTDIASSAARTHKHPIHQILRRSSRPNCLPKRSISPLATCENDSIKQLSLNKESSTKTAADPSSFMYDHHRPVRTIKRKINPRFMNSYEVLDFIPDIRRSSASGS